MRCVIRLKAHSKICSRNSYLLQTMLDVPRLSSGNFPLSSFPPYVAFHRYPHLSLLDCTSNLAAEFVFPNNHDYGRITYIILSISTSDRVSLLPSKSFTSTCFNQ